MKSIVTLEFDSHAKLGNFISRLQPDDLFTIAFIKATESVVKLNQAINNSSKILKDKKDKKLKVAKPSSGSDKKLYDHVCEECTNNFQTHFPKTRFCSQSCNQKNWLKRKNEKIAVIEPEKSAEAPKKVIKPRQGSD